jgi:hypothetical protein
MPKKKGKKTPRKIVIRVRIVPLEAVPLPKPNKRRDVKLTAQPDVLKGWREISAFLSEPVSVVRAMGEGGYAGSSRG